MALLVFGVGLAFGAFTTASNAVPSINGGDSDYDDVASVYVRHCASCHGRDGRAKTPKGKRTYARDLTGTDWQSEVSDERIFNSIMNGRGKMPVFGKRLPEAMIDALVSYVRSLKK